MENFILSEEQEKARRAAQESQTVEINKAIDKVILPLQANIFLEIAKNEDKDNPLTHLKPALRNIITAICIHPNCSMGDLAKYTGINFKNLHYYVNTLEKANLVKRNFCPTDRKVIQITYTDKLNYYLTLDGLKSYEVTKAIYEKYLTEEERQEMLTHLKAIGILLEKLSPCSPEYTNDTSKTKRLLIKDI